MAIGAKEVEGSSGEVVGEVTLKDWKHLKIKGKKTGREENGNDL